MHDSDEITIQIILMLVPQQLITIILINIIIITNLPQTSTNTYTQLTYNSKLFVIWSLEIGILRPSHLEKSNPPILSDSSPRRTCLDLVGTRVSSLYRSFPFERIPRMNDQKSTSFSSWGLAPFPTEIPLKSRQMSTASTCRTSSSSIILFILPRSFF